MSYGTDLDDIQSWLAPSTATEFYVREAARTHAAKRFTAALIATPIAYLPIFLLLRTRRVRTTEPADAPKDRSSRLNYGDSTAGPR
jgi:hypothetical protein